MTLAYVPPGVTVQELTSPSIAPLLAIPGSVCLVGPASGALTRTDLITLTGTTAVVLPNVPTTATMASGAISQVIDAINPSIAPNGYSSATDYTFNATNHTIVRQVTASTTANAPASGQPSFTLVAGAVPAVGQVVRLTDTGGSPVTETVTVLTVVGQVVTATTNLVNTYHAGSAASWGTIPDGNSVFVTYSYTPVDYFQPIRLNSMADIQNRFGNAWDPTNTVINSALSFAAGLAFQNGASNVVLQPLYNVNTSGVRVQPTNPQVATPAVWSTVFTGLLDLEDINIVVPVVGQSLSGVTDSIMLQIEEATQDFVYQMLQGEDHYLVGILGEDSSGSTSVAQEPTLTAHAETLIPRYNASVTEQLVFVNTSQFSVANATGTFLVGGQYAAAAVAGMLASRDPASTLTRQVVAGLQSVTDVRSKSQKNADAANGMLVLESIGQVVQVRHGITMDLSSVVTRELNVVRAKHFIVESLRNTLDTQIIGKLVADADAPTILNNVTIATLEDLRGLNALSNYANVESRITSIDPTAMEVRFDYLPTFVVNYINIAFTLDLTAQTILVTSNGSTG